MNNSLFTITELDKEDLTSTSTCVIQDGDTSSNFVINSFICHALQSEYTGICLISLHYSFNHYFFSLRKFGCNLKSSIENGQAIHLDYMENVSDISDKKFLLDSDFLINFIQRITDSIRQMSSKFEKTWIIIDNISDLINSGFSLQETVQFTKQLQSLIVKFPKLTSILGCDYNTDDTQQCVLKSVLMNGADFRIVLSPLSTGFHQDVTGSIKFSKKNEKSIKLWNKDLSLLFKVSDRNVKFFTPGSV